MITKPYEIEDDDYDLMVLELLKNNVLLVNSRNYNYNFSNTETGHTLVLFVICSDVFAWGMADAEDISLSELPTLYNMDKVDKKWGSTKWCCIKRNEQPQKPVREMMQKEGVWDDNMEKLPVNRYDTMCKERKI